MKRVRFLSALVLAGALALSACAPAPQTLAQPSKGAAGPVEVTLTATEFKFEPATVTVPAGRPVHLTFQNKGGIPHDMEIKGLEAKDVKITEEMEHEKAEAQKDDHEDEGKGVHLGAKPGGKGTAEFVATKPGTYQIVCEYAGHTEAGQKATLVVQ